MSLGIEKVLSNLEQEEAWIQAWDELDILMDKNSESYLLLPEYREASLSEVQGWIQGAAYESNRTTFKIEYDKGKNSILINKVPA